MRTAQARRIVLAQENQKWGACLAPIPREDWPPRVAGAPYPGEAFRSRDFLVQVFVESTGWRLSINRAELGSGGKWRAEISWDELQRLKSEAGYGTHWAMEIYPPDDQVVNVANMRHLWIPDSAPCFGWRRRP